MFRILIGLLGFTLHFSSEHQKIYQIWHFCFVSSYHIVLTVLVISKLLLVEEDPEALFPFFNLKSLFPIWVWAYEAL